MKQFKKSCERSTFNLYFCWKYTDLYNWIGDCLEILIKVLMLLTVKAFHCNHQNENGENQIH